MMAERVTRSMAKSDSAILQAVLDLSPSTTDISDDLDYLEGPWLEMPHNLIRDIEVHLDNGGDEDFARLRWKESKTLAQALPDTPTRFELFGYPDIILPAGRFSYKKRRQIIVVSLPPFGSREQTSFVIAFHKKEIVFSPNNHKGCFGYNWCIWLPHHLRGSNYNKQKQLILRIYVSPPGSVEARSKKRTMDEHHESPIKRRKLTLKIAPEKLASLQLEDPAILKPQISDKETQTLDNVDQVNPIDSSTSRASSQDLSLAPASITVGSSVLNEVSLAPSTHLESPAELQQGRLVPGADKLITITTPVDTSAENTSIGHDENFNVVEPTIEEDSDALDSVMEPHIEEINAVLPNETTAVVQELAAAKAADRPPPNLVHDNADSQSPPEPTTLSESTTLLEPAANIDPFKYENVIVIEDDNDESEVKKEAASGVHTYSPWQQGVPPPFYPGSVMPAHATIGFNPVEAVQPAHPPQHNLTDASRFLYPNVRVEFRDAAGTVRDEKPFCRCASARDLFEAAMEADILGPHIRMFVVQVGAGQSMNMRFEDDESFREKLLGPLHELLNHNDGAKVTIRVHGLVYRRA